jgi:hypothetical protein
MKQAAQHQGRVLRVKRGYNPNSSSMGSIIFALPVSLMAVTVGLGAISSLLLSLGIEEKAPHAKGPVEEVPGEPEPHPERRNDEALK